MRRMIVSLSALLLCVLDGIAAVQVTKTYCDNNSAKAVSNAVGQVNEIVPELVKGSISNVVDKILPQKIQEYCDAGGGIVVTNDVYIETYVTTNYVSYTTNNIVNNVTNIVKEVITNSVYSYNFANWSNSTNIAAGEYSRASGDGSTALGSLAKAYGKRAITVGYGASYGDFSTALGYNNNSYGSKSIALGYHNTTYTDAVNAIALGYENTATKLNSITIGYMNESTDDSALAIGYENYAQGNNSFAFGQGNASTGDSSSSIGINNKSSGDTSSSFGYDNEASGEFSVAVGSNNSANGYMSAAFGYGNTVTDEFSVAVGNSNLVDGYYATAFGINNAAHGEKSTALGYNAFTSNAWNGALAVSQSPDEIYLNSKKSDSGKTANTLQYYLNATGWRYSIPKTNTYITVSNFNTTYNFATSASGCTIYIDSSSTEWKKDASNNFAIRMIPLSSSAKVGSIQLLNPPYPSTTPAIDYIGGETSVKSAISGITYFTFTQVADKTWKVTRESVE